MTIFKIGDTIRVKPNAYNIADHRFGRVAKVTHIDPVSELLPIRIEYDSFSFSWTNNESLELVETGPTENEVKGKDILDKMEELKASIVTRDAAIQLVEQQTVALDALLASVGLKRGEVVKTSSLAPVVRTALDDYKAGIVEEGFQYKLAEGSRISTYLTGGRVYTVESLDMDDPDAPIGFEDNDGDDHWPSTRNLSLFTRIA